MRTFFYSTINNIMVAWVFTLASVICCKNIIYGCIAYLIAFIYLDLHSYIDKKLNYPNNLFIKKS